MIHRRHVVAGLAGAGSMSLAKPTILKAQTQRTIRIGQIFPATHPYHKGLLKFAEEVGTRTSNAIKVEVYSDGHLGGEVAMVQGMRTGTVDGGTAAAGTLGQTINQRKFYVLDMPFLFKGHEDYERWAEGPLAQELQAGVPERAGVRILAFATAGFSQILNAKRPISKPEDLRGLKMRVWQSRSAQLSFEITNMTATPMPYGEVFTSLQQGVIDGLVNTMTTLYQTKMHEVAKYLSISNHIVAVMPILLSERVFQSVGKPEQEAIQESARVAAKYWRGLYPEEDRVNLARLREGGCMVNEVDQAAFRQFTRERYDRFIDLINEPGARELVERFKNFSS